IVGVAIADATSAPPNGWTKPVYWPSFNQPARAMWSPTLRASPEWINNKGNVVGEAEDSAGNDVPLYWPSPSGHFVRLATAVSIWAAEINENGLIIGDRGDAPGLYAVLWPSYSSQPIVLRPRTMLPSST